MPDKMPFKSDLPKPWADFLPDIDGPDNDERTAAIRTVMVSSYLHRPEALAHLADDGKLEQIMDWARQAEPFRADALRTLSPQDLQWLRDGGFIRVGE